MCIKCNLILNMLWLLFLSSSSSSGSWACVWLQSSGLARSNYLRKPTSSQSSKSNFSGLLESSKPKPRKASQSINKFAEPIRLLKMTRPPIMPIHHVSSASGRVRWADNWINVRATRCLTSDVCAWFQFSTRRSRLIPDKRDVKLPSTSYVDKPCSLIQLPERSPPNDGLIDVSISIYESEWWDRDDRLLIATLQLLRSLLWEWKLMDERRSCDCTSFFTDTITQGDTLAIGTLMWQREMCDIY